MVNSIYNQKNASDANFLLAKINISFTNNVIKTLTKRNCHMDKALVAQTVANRLFATENAIDVALVEASQLLQAMLQARQDLRISAVVGDRAPAQLAQAIAALSAARTAVVETHGELAEAKLRVGIRTKLIGVYRKEGTHQADLSGSAQIDRIAG
jgi:hypothetical protein